MTPPLQNEIHSHNPHWSPATNSSFGCSRGAAIAFCPWSPHAWTIWRDIHSFTAPVIKEREVRLDGLFLPPVEQLQAKPALILEVSTDIENCTTSDTEK